MITKRPEVWPSLTAPANDPRNRFTHGTELTEHGHHDIRVGR